MNPVRALAEEFSHRSPMTLLVFGGGASLVDSGLLYMAAAKEGVLYITQGVGLLSNYGLVSTLIGNAVLPYLAKKYYDGVFYIRESKAVVHVTPVEESLSTLTDMIRIEREYHQRSLYLMMIIGALLVLLRYARLAGVHMEAFVDDDLDLPEKLPASVKQEEIRRAYKPRVRRRWPI